MRIPVGPYEYELVLSDEPVMLDGEEKVAVCDCNLQEIQISAKYPPHVRLARFWHELAHAIAWECDPFESGRIGGEPLANVFALGLARLDAATIGRIVIYLQQGIECERIMMSPGMKGHPIPVLTMTAPCCPAGVTPPTRRPGE